MPSLQNVSTSKTGARYLPIAAQSWLALFFDLAFVAAIVVVSNSYSKDYSLGQIGALIMVFTLIWTTWLMTTLRMQSAQVITMWPRVLIVLQMGLVLLMGITANDFVENTTESVGSLFGLIIATFVLLNRALTTPDAEDRMTRGELIRLEIAIAMFLATWWAPDSSPVYAVLWIAGLALVLSTTRSPAEWNADDRHALGHRFGEFTIIVLGESFLKIALVAGEEPLEAIDLFALPLVFCVITALWWLYFAHIEPIGVPPRYRGWILTHLPFHLFVVGLAVGLSKLLVPSASAYSGSGFGLITAPLVGALLCLAALIRLGQGPFAHRGMRVLILSAVAVLAVVGLNYLGRGLEFDLAGTVLLLAIVLAGTIRVMGRYAPPDQLPVGAGAAPLAPGTGHGVPLAPD